LYALYNVSSFSRAIGHQELMLHAYYSLLIRGQLYFIKETL
jgi:hypothetical protein